MSRLEIVGVAVNVFGQDGSNGINNFLLDFWRPLGDLRPKFFECFWHKAGSK